jgi:uncharacterized protein YukE
MFGSSQHGDIDEGPHMSKMADLYIEISDQLSEESKAFQAAEDCMCNSCEQYTIDEIDAQFKKMGQL